MLLKPESRVGYFAEATLFKSLRRMETIRRSVQELAQELLNQAYDPLNYQ